MTRSILAAVVLAIGAGCAGAAIDYEVNRARPVPMLDQRILAPALHSHAPVQEVAPPERKPEPVPLSRKPQGHLPTVAPSVGSRARHTPKGHPYHHREPGDDSANALNRSQL